MNQKTNNDKKLIEFGYIPCLNLPERIDIFIYEIEETEMYLLVLRINGNPIKATVTIISQQVFNDHLSGISGLELFDETVKLCNVFTCLIVFLKKLYYV